MQPKSINRKTLLMSSVGLKALKTSKIVTLEFRIIGGAEIIEGGRGGGGWTGLKK